MLTLAYSIIHCLDSLFDHCGPSWHLALMAFLWSFRALMSSWLCAWWPFVVREHHPSGVFFSPLRVLPYVVACSPFLGLVRAFKCEPLVRFGPSIFMGFGFHAVVNSIRLTWPLV